MKSLSEAREYFNKHVFDVFPNDDFVIAGGAIRDYLMYGKVTNDIDIFFNCFHKYNHLVTETLKIDSRWDKDKLCTVIFSRRSDVTILNESYNGALILLNGIKYHIISFNAHELDKDDKGYNKFDFTINMFSMDRDNTYQSYTALDDLENMRLINNPNNLPNPELMKRTCKFIDRGFSISGYELDKVVRLNSYQSVRTEEEYIKYKESNKYGS